MISLRGQHIVKFIIGTFCDNFQSQHQTTPVHLEFLSELIQQWVEHWTFQTKHCRGFPEPDFLCISLNFSAFLCVSLRFSAFLWISLHFSAVLWISLHFSVFLCISLHFSKFLCNSLHLTVYILGQFDETYHRSMDQMTESECTGYCTHVFMFISITIMVIP